VPVSTLSFHLKELIQAGLVVDRHEGRFVFYSEKVGAMNALVGYLTKTCSPLMKGKVYNVLFLCTHNSASSLMAEAILNNLAVSRGHFKAYSAGSHTSGNVNPFALSQIQRSGLSVKGLRSKDWNEFAKPDAPKMDFVFTVCDNVANEVSPVWPGRPMTAHWGSPAPAAIEGSDKQKRLAFTKTYHYLSNRINIFTSLPVDKLDKLSLQKKLEEIGKKK